jgi:hypothetical protein
MRRGTILSLLLVSLPAVAQDPPPLLLRLDVPKQEVWIGQRVTVTLTAMTPVRFAAAPTFPDLAPAGRTLVLPEGTTVPGTERVGGQSLAALQHSYDFFPAQAGDLTLPPIHMRASVGGPDGQPVPAEATTEPARIVVRPLPGGAPELARLAVTPSLRVTVQADRQPQGLRTGEAITRTIRMEAEDSAAMLLPPAQWGQPDGVAIYPDPPVLQDRTDRGALMAMRTERAAYVPQRPGPVELPGFTIPWFDPRSGELHEARVEALRFEVLPAEGAGDEQTAAPGRSSYWPWVAALVVLALLAIVALFVLRRHRRPYDPARDAFHALARACRDDTARPALAALFRWADMELSGRGASAGKGPAQLAAMTQTPELAEEAQRLETQLCGRDPATKRWRGKGLLAAARRARRRLRDHPDSPRSPALPPLNPGSGVASSPRLVLPNWAR